MSRLLREDPLIPNEEKTNTPSAGGGLVFTLSSGKGERQKNPVDPVESDKSLAEKTVEDVLLHFGDNLREARRRYRQFIKNGVDQGKRPELQGGGLVRPACHRENTSFGYPQQHNEFEGKTGNWNSVYLARAGRSAGGNRAGFLKNTVNPV